MSIPSFQVLPFPTRARYLLENRKECRLYALCIPAIGRFSVLSLKSTVIPTFTEK